mgnify:CR=1 FL=1
MAHLIGVIGNPGEAKSDLARSATVVGKTAVAMLEAGASRIGASSTATILDHRDAGRR